MDCTAADSEHYVNVSHCTYSASHGKVCIVKMLFLSLKKKLLGKKLEKERRGRERESPVHWSLAK